MAVIGIMRRTAAEFTTHNPSLSRDVIGLESDTGRLKIGDGSTTWSSLSYFGEGGEGGGASAFTDLTDAPDALASNALMRCNTAADALETSSSITETDTGAVYIQPPAGQSLVLRGGSDTTITTLDDGGDLSIDGAEEGTTSLKSHNGDLRVEVMGASGDLYAGSGSGLAQLYGGEKFLEISDAGGFKMVGLPTSDPAVLGALYTLAGALMVSAG